MLSSLSLFLWVLCLFFPGCFCSVLFFIDFEQFDYDIPRCSFLHASCAWGSLRFLDHWAYSFQQIWKNVSIIFSKIFSIFFWGLKWHIYEVTRGFPTVNLLHLLFLYYLCFILDSFYWYILCSLIFCFAISNIPWSLLSKFIISYIVIFISKSSIYVFLKKIFHCFYSNF